MLLSRPTGPRPSPASASPPGGTSSCPRRRLEPASPARPAQQLLPTTSPPPILGHHGNREPGSTSLPPLLPPDPRGASLISPLPLCLMPWPGCTRLCFRPTPSSHPDPAALLSPFPQCSSWPLRRGHDWGACQPLRPQELVVPVTSPENPLNTTPTRCGAGNAGGRGCDSWPGSPKSPPGSQKFWATAPPWDAQGGCVPWAPQ